MKFTQEIKNNWINALKSGEYKQGFGGLVVDKNGYSLHNDETEKFHCCIGVLGEITEGLTNKNYDETDSPYDFLRSTIGAEKMVKLYHKNDERPRNIARDYSNVIPLIEALEVQE